MKAKEEQHYQSEINMETKQLLSHEEVMVTKEEQHYQSDLATLIDNVKDDLSCIKHNGFKFHKEQHYQSELKMETKPQMSHKM